MRAAAGEVEKASTEVHLVHLMFHLKANAVLTDEQRSVHQQARWNLHRPMGPPAEGPPGAGAPMK